MDRVAVVCSRYPAVSHAFIVREVRALRGLGLDLHTFSVRRPSPDELLSWADREESERTTALLPPNLLRLVAAHLRALLTQPVRYGATLGHSLSLSTGGLRAALWRVFYFAESVLLWDECRRREIKRLHAHFANVGSDVAMLAAHLGGGEWSWSFTMHGCTELFDESPHRLPQKVSDAAVVVCNSDFTRAQLMKLVDREEWPKLRVVRCGVDPLALEPPLRRADGGPLRILSVGRLVPGKGHAILLDALARVQDEGVETVTTLVGDGPERRSLEAYAAELCLDVRFAGAVGQDELRSFYEDAQLFCLPTFAEGLGVVLLEAMACGLPVVSTLVMGVPEVVDDGQTGLLVSPGRPDLLAEALARLAEAPDLRERMGLAGRRRVLEDFDVRQEAEAMAALLGIAGARVQGRVKEAEPAAAAA